MISRKELMDWLNTCPDHHWDIVHEDEGHMRVLFVFDDDMTFMHQSEVIEKFGHLVEASSDDWDAFLDELRGLTYVESKDDGYIVQEIDHDYA